MQDKAFIDFITNTSTRGGATYNLKTQNVSKQARNILQDTQYKALAKAHINSNIVKAYHNNKDFAQKLQEVMQQNNITLIA